METAILLPLLGLLLLLLLLLVYKYGTRSHGTLEKLGIPVIKPFPFFGSYLQPWTKYVDKEDMRNARRFGGIWGQYDGMVPSVYIGNVELAKRVLIKDFDYFQDRPNLFDFEYGRDMMDLLKGARWKAVRSVFSKMITSGAKLKAMMPTIRDCSEAAFRRLDAKLSNGSEMIIKEELFGPLVLDVMTQFSFGIKVPNINDQTNPFIQNANIFATGDEEPPAWRSALKMILPANDDFKAFIQPSFKFFCDVLRKSVKERRTNGGSHNDIVDVMIDAIDNKVPTKEFRDLNITEDTILIQGAELLMASYGTTATVLSFCTYYLTQYPDIMARVVEEVEGEAELTYEALQRLPLLEAVLHETLRLTPSVLRHVRECTRDWEHDGVTIPAGTSVMVAAMPLHLDPAEFADPERFLPDRWLDEEGRKLGQYHWMPFGLGPRACLGTRLAILEVKYVIACLLMRYRVSACKKTQLQLKRGLSIFNDFHSIWVKVDKR